MTTPVNIFSLVLLRLIRYLELVLLIRIQFFACRQLGMLAQCFANAVSLINFIFCLLLECGVPTIGSGAIGLLKAPILANSSVFSVLLRLSYLTKIFRRVRSTITRIKMNRFQKFSER